MQKHTDVVQNRLGMAVEGAKVLVTDISGSVATIFSNNGTTQQANPMTTNANGRFAFYAADGRYNLTVTINNVQYGEQRDILLNDPADPSPEKIDGGVIVNSQVNESEVNDCTITGGTAQQVTVTGSTISQSELEDVTIDGLPPMTVGGQDHHELVEDVQQLTAQSREALRRSYADAGYNLVDGSFEEGGVLTSTDDVMITASGYGYSWAGTYPVGGYSVAPDTDPTVVGSEYVPRSDVLLRNELATQLGAGMLGFSHSELYSPATAGFRLKNAVYATDSPFNAPTDGSDAASHINAALTYCAANNKDLILDRLFTVASTITIPSNVSVICLTRQCGINSTAIGVKAVSVAGMNSKFIGGTIKGINNPASTTIRQDGIYMGPTSSFCEIVDVHVYGFFAKGFTGPGSGIGAGDGGVCNKIKGCRVVDSKFCVNLGGKNGEVVGNYISNHYLTQTVETKPFTQLSNYWDGIVAEGIEDYLIAFNIVTECGQSGIYTGGNGGLSKFNRIIGNLVEKCWNRGIDQGNFAAQSATNDVIGVSIVANICRNNREPNIWLAGTTRCTVIGNTSIYDAEYPELFAGYYGGHMGISFTNGTKGAVPHGNIITGNNCYDSEGYQNISISCGLSASGNVINGNAAPQGYWLVNASLYASNDFDFLNAPNWTPQLIGGSGTVTLGSSTGRTVIRGKKANFSITINVASVSSPSGMLTIGYVPPLSGVTLRYSDVKVTLFDGLDSTIGASQLVAYMAGSDQVAIARCLNGSRLYDVRQFLKAGSSITISGEVEFYS